MNQMAAVKEQISGWIIDSLSQLDKENPDRAKGWMIVQIIAKIIQTVPMEELKKTNFNQFYAAYFLDDLQKHDKVFIDTQMGYVCSIRKEGYYLYSEILAGPLSQYSIDPVYETLHAKAGTPVLNFKETVALFLTQMKDLDHEKAAAFDALVKSEALLLDEKEAVPKVGLHSYPRAGSHFFQTIIQAITGIQTGSSMPKPFLQFALAGIKGASITDNRVFIPKTHHPLIMAPARDAFLGKKSIVLIRNPVDAFISEFHLNLTMSQSLHLANEFHVEFAQAWNTHFGFCVQFYKRYAEYWMKKAEQKRHPVYIIRYEDLFTQRERILTELYSFIFEQDITGTFLHARIQHFCNNQEPPKLYKPRAGPAFDNSKYFTPEMFKVMESELKEVLLYYGLFKNERISKAYFEFPDAAAHPLTEGYQKSNARQHEETLKLKEEEIEPINLKEDPDALEYTSRRPAQFALAYLSPKLVFKE